MPNGAITRDSLLGVAHERAHRVPAAREPRRTVAADQAGRARDEDLHARPVA
jgi:hypothetical protein